ncbi:MAG TPA: hypothetical protein VHD34_10245 [Xanthobacteraceae bacterium]|nr:hypothetical protein [Xanthobacteraceae bacterium]
MKKLLLGMTAAAALAVATPGVALAQHGGGHGGGGASISGGGGGGGHISGGGGGGRGGASANVSGGGRSMGSHGNFSSRGDISRGSHHRMSSDRGARRHFSDRHVRGDRFASRDFRHDRHHRHHRHFRDRDFSLFIDTPDYYYNDYAYYDPCYRTVWTSFGWRYVNTCTSYYYGVY